MACPKFTACQNRIRASALSLRSSSLSFHLHPNSLVLEVSAPEHISAAISVSHRDGMLETPQHLGYSSPPELPRISPAALESNVRIQALALAINGTLHIFSCYSFQFCYLEVKDNCDRMQWVPTVLIPLVCFISHLVSGCVHGVHDHIRQTLLLRGLGFA